MRVSMLKTFALTSLLALAAAAPAAAQSVADAAIAELRASGFQKISVTRTLLGRVLVLGSSLEGQREIVINPNTGEILRDYFRPRMMVASSNDNDDDNDAPKPDRPDRPSKPDKDPNPSGGGGSGIAGGGTE
jgi:hypothetical protein